MKKNEKGFIEKYQNLLIVALILGVIIFAGYNDMIPGINFSITQPTTNTTNQYYTPPTYNPETPTTTDNVDFRVLFAPYAATTDAQTTCVALGGTWVFERDHVGCIGAGPIDCGQPAILAAQVQCIGAGGNWVCGIDNLYCIK